MSTADKLMATFALFDTDRVEWTVEAAAAELAIPASTAYPYFRALNEAGLVVAISPGRYVLGPTIVMLDRRMRLTDPLIVPGNEVIQQIKSLVDIPGVFLLCRLFRRQVMCLLSEDVNNSGLLVGYERGRLMPLYRGAASKVILAGLPARTVRGFFDQEPHQFAQAGLGADWESVKRALRGIRSQGGTVTYGEIDTGLIGLASPIMAADDTVLGSLGFVSSAQNMSDGTIKRIQGIVAAAAARITEAQKREP